jgi:hypothetical protein
MPNYRCNRCLEIEMDYLEPHNSTFTIPCSKCGGLAIKLPISDSIKMIFRDSRQNQIVQHLRTPKIG